MFLLRHCFIVMNIFSRLEAMKTLFKVCILCLMSSGLYTFSYILKSMIFLIENFFVVSTYIVYFAASLAFLIY
jgi:hypothetical protein